MRDHIFLVVLSLCFFCNPFCSAQSGNIYTFAGNGTPGFSGDGGMATAAQLNSPSDVFEDASGNFYIADKGNNRIRKVNTSGIISTIVGTGVPGYSGDGGLALAATLNAPNRVVVDGAGNIFIADESNNVIRMVNTSGIISTIAGTGVAGFTGDGGPATIAELNDPTGVAVDLSGNVFISDHGSSRIRTINTSGIISTYAGGGGTGFTVDGVPATSISLCGQNYVSVDNAGTVYLTNYSCWHFLKVTTAGLMYNVAGYMAPSYSGDCGPADSADIHFPFGICPDNLGNVYLCPQGNIRVRKVNTLNYITTVAGTGVAGYTGDGGPAISATVSSTIDGIYADGVGNVYFADMGNNVIRNFTSSVYTDTVSMCPGGIDTLHDTTGSGTWVSSNPAVATVGSLSGIVTGIASGTATITYTNIACPELFLVIVTAPTITSGPVCAGSAVTFSGTPVGGNWSSSNPAVATVGSSTGVVTGVVAGTATITYTLPGGCFGITAITVNPTPTPISDTSVCAGSAITLSYSTGGGTWSSGSPGVATIGSGTGVVTGVAGGIAIMTYVLPVGCYATGTVTVNTVPPVTGSTSVCVGSTITLSDAAGGGTWSSGSPGTATVGSGTGIVNGISPGAAVISYISVAGCIASTAITVIALPPYPSIIVVNPYCEGQPFIPFTVSGTGVLWYNVPTGGSGNPVAPTVNTNIPGTDSFYATQTVDGCESPRQLVAITVLDSIIPVFNYTIHYGCKADTVLFNNSSTGAVNYAWDFGDGHSDTVANPTHVYLTQDTFIVNLTAINSHCSNSKQDTIILMHPLLAAFIDSPDILCQDNPVTFTNNSVGTGLSYTWYLGNGTISNTTNPTYTYLNSGVYRVQLVATDFVPCHDTATGIVYVDSQSYINMSVTDSVLCRSAYSTFRGVYTGIGNTGVTWDFGNGDSIKNINPVAYAYDTTGTFIVVVTAHYRSCRDTSFTRRVTVYPQPYVNLGTDTSICAGSNPLVLADNINTQIPKAQWKWNTGQTTPSITVTTPGAYYVIVNIGGCTTTDSITVSNDCYLDIPNVFTPNGDGLNDYFFPRLELTKGLTAFRMEIYNRWGQLIFETTNLEGTGWDGKFNNMDQPEGVYVYVIDATFKDGQKEHHQGNVTLLR